MEKKVLKTYLRKMVVVDFLLSDNHTFDEM